MDGAEKRDGIRKWRREREGKGEKEWQGKWKIGQQMREDENDKWKRGKRRGQAKKEKSKEIERGGETIDLLNEIRRKLLKLKDIFSFRTKWMTVVIQIRFGPSQLESSVASEHLVPVNPAEKNI